MRRLHILFIMSATLLITSCSTTGNGLTVGNVSNTECLRNVTRSTLTAQTTKLKLTRNGSNLNGVFLDYQVNCSHGELSVDCRQEGNRLSVNVREKNEDGAIKDLCLCPVNIYFTAYDIEGETF